MIITLGRFRLSFARSSLAFGLSLSACGPTIELVPSPAETPGVSLTLASGSLTGTSGITVESHYGFSGPVGLNALCCQDVIRDTWVPLTAPNFAWTFTNPSPYPSKGGTATSALNISVPLLNTGPFPNLVPSMPFGKYVMTVIGKSQSGPVITDSVKVGVRVLPFSEPAPGCKPGVEVFPLGPAVLAQITAAEASPRKTSTTVAIYRTVVPAGGGDAFGMTIEDESGLPVIHSRIVLVHKSTKNEDKMLSTIGCSTAGKSITATKSTPTSVQMLLIYPQDRTLVFRENVPCTGLLCGSNVWVDVGVFSEPAFWSVFGGKKVTFEWHECTPVLLWCI